MDHDFGSWGSKGCSVVIEGAMYLSPGREVGIDPGASHEVQSHESLRQQFVPKMKWKVFVGAAETGDEMVFEGANGSFSSVRCDDGCGEVQVGSPHLGLPCMLVGHGMLRCRASGVGDVGLGN